MIICVKKSSEITKPPSQRMQARRDIQEALVVMNRPTKEFVLRGAERAEAPKLATPAGLTPQRVVSSEALFRGAHEIGIEHEGALYRLKITRQGKLILNK
jgi:hemin uptake protein HemP